MLPASIHSREIRAREAVPSLAAERLSLPGGRAVLLRPIDAHDAQAEQAFVAGLSLDSRHKRFHIGLRELSPTLLRAMVEVDQRDHVALVAQALRPHAGGLVADARYVRSASNRAEAEFAIAVADEWQSLGLGRLLLARLIDHARRAGVRTFIGDVLFENRRMLVLMRGLGAEARTHPDGAQLVRVELALDDRVGGPAR